MTGVWVSIALGLLGALTGIAFSMGRIVTAVVVPDVSLTSGLLGLLVSIVAAAVSVNVARAERSAALTLAACAALGMLALPGVFTLPAVLMLLPGIWMPVRMWLTARRGHAGDGGLAIGRAHDKGAVPDAAPPELDDAAFSGRFIPSPELVKPDERYDPIDDIAADDSVFDPNAPSPSASPDNPFDSVELLVNDDSLFEPDDGAEVDFEKAARYEAEYAELLENAPAVEAVPAPVMVPVEEMPNVVEPDKKPDEKPDEKQDEEPDEKQDEEPDEKPDETPDAPPSSESEPTSPAKYRPYNKKKRDRRRASKK